MISFSRSEICCSADRLPATASAAHLLRLRIRVFEGHGLDEVHIGLRRALAVARRGVNADDVARHEFEVLERKHGVAFGLLHALLIQQIDYFFRTAVDGVVKVQFLKRKFVLARNRNLHFFDRADFGVFARTRDGKRGGADLAGFDEVVVSEAHVFAVVHYTDVIGAVFLDGNVDGGLVIDGRGDVQRFIVFDDELSAGKGTVRGDLQFRYSAFDGAEVTARIFNRGGYAGPRGVVVSDVNVFDAGQIDGVELKRIRLHAVG